MLRRRILIAIAIGLFYGVAGYMYRSSQTGYNNIGDVYWALYTIQELLQGRDPYGFTADQAGYFVPYPLPVALVGLPLFWMPGDIASAIFVTLSFGALAFLVTAEGKWWRLLIFASLPMYVSSMYAQWSALMLCAWFVPAAAPTLALFKPHIALPLVLQRLTWRGIIIAGVIGLISIAIYPSWPFRWLGMLGNFQQFIPLITLPFGPLLILAALAWRNERARLILIMALLPMRSIYDLCALWLVPQTAKQMLLLTLCGWIPLFTITGSGPGTASVVPLVFLPALAIALYQSKPWEQWRKTPIAKQS
jgi:hypothetical protein